VKYFTALFILFLYIFFCLLSVCRVLHCIVWIEINNNNNIAQLLVCISSFHVLIILKRKCCCWWWNGPRYNMCSAVCCSPHVALQSVVFAMTICPYIYLEYLCTVWKRPFRYHFYSLHGVQAYTIEEIGTQRISVLICSDWKVMHTNSNVQRYLDDCTVGWRENK